jgi:four helix bundle protein
MEEMESDEKGFLEAADEKANVIVKKSFAFAVRAVKLYQFLVKEKGEFVLSKQMMRSATSIGANVEEAEGAISKADFTNKISIAYKEARETHYWIRLLHATDYLDKIGFDAIVHDSEELCRILRAILNTLKTTKSKV